MASFCRISLAGVLGLVMLAGWGFAEDMPGVVAYYPFDEGAGDCLHDRSGHGNDGQIVGAEWVSENGVTGLHFGGHGDYVEFKDNRSLKRAGDMTLLAWVHLDAPLFPDETTNWSIIDCERYREEGFLLRVDGGASRLLFRTNQAGADQGNFGVAPLANHTSHLIGLVRQNGNATLYLNGRPDGNFPSPDPIIGSAPFRISSAGQSFHGVMYSIMLFDRALTADELASYYWRDAKRFGRDASQQGQLVLKPRIYYAEQEAQACLDFLGVMPVGTHEKATVALARQHGEILATQDVLEFPKEGFGEYRFSLKGLSAGAYELRASFVSETRAATASAPFTYPAPALSVPAPEAMLIPPVPQIPAPPAMQVNVAPDGGVQLTLAGTSFEGRSSFSIPGGGENRLAASPMAGSSNEPEWKPSIENTGNIWRINASGKTYSLTREMTVETGRIFVKDTLANTSPAPIGIVFHNWLSGGENMSSACIGGKETISETAGRDLKTCPIVMLSRPDLGVGLVALDDVYIVQCRGAYSPALGVDLFSNEFALDTGAQYTLEWAVYINATGDFFDVVNALRQDENRNSVTVAGGLGMLPGGQSQRDASRVPASPFFSIRNLRYFTVPCLSWCADDPEISIEGIEFIEHPLERQRIRGIMDAVHGAQPEIKGMFHIAHQLFATNTPEQHFPDSRVIDEGGKHAVYPMDYDNTSYFSRQRALDNWRWWIYYPTLENSFGKAMLDSVDVMMDEMGTRGVFADGFQWGYGGVYTYDRWDGHSADIAMDTFTIQRKKASVLLLSQEAMIAWCKKIWGKGGVVIANGVVPTRTICAQPLIMDKEVTEGPDVALLTTPVTLGNPGACRNDSEVYEDVLNKLRWGNLYFYYGEPAALAYPSIPAHMYPITIQSLHRGCIQGQERIITMNAGVYGWAESRDLHLAHRFDPRGHAITPGYLTTVDASGVRTRVDLEEKESAVLVRIPVRIESANPVNVMVEQYDGNRLVMKVNGQGQAKVVMAGHEPYEITMNGQTAISLPK